jgi:PAS domain S-box-containing protein
MTVISRSSTAADTSIAFGLIAPDRRFVAVSEAFAQLLGYTPAELCGRTLESITCVADADAVGDMDQLFGGEIASYEIADRCEDRDGNRLQAMLQVSTACDARGKIAFAIVQLRPAEANASATPGHRQTGPVDDEVEKIKRAMFW